MFLKISKKLEIIRSKFYYYYFKFAYQKKITYGNNILFGTSVKIYDSSDFECHLGSNINFRGYFNFIYFHCSISERDLPKLTIGDNCFFNLNCSISTGNGQIQIGSNCLFGENVKVYNHNHCFNRSNKLISLQGYSFGDVMVGNNVWIGSNSVILKGVNIGDNCVVSAGSIVKKSIPSNCLYSKGTFKKINYQ